MVVKLCCAPGCDDLAEVGLPRCADHEGARLDKLRAARRRAKATPAAKAGKILYATADWQAARVTWLSIYPLCVECSRDGLIVAANEVDHVTPHRGDLALFWDRRNWQGLCKRCHSRKTAREVLSGVRFGYSIPYGIRPAVMPVTLVAGPPAAGKTTYVTDKMGPRDLVIDLDHYIARLGGGKWDQDKVRVRAAFALRDADLLRLHDPIAPRVWIVMLAPDGGERAAWLRALGSKAEWKIIAPPRAVVMEQLMGDASRIGRRTPMIAEIDRWYRLNP